jgi:hypothetical protein
LKVSGNLKLGKNLSKFLPLYSMELKMNGNTTPIFFEQVHAISAYDIGAYGGWAPNSPGFFWHRGFTHPSSV